MESASNTSPKPAPRTVNIDATLVFDVDSLLFCVARKHVANENAEKSHEFKTASVYAEIVNKPAEHAVKNICVTFDLQDSTCQAIMDEYHSLLPSVKPNFPAMQLIKWLQGNNVTVMVNTRSITDEQTVTALKAMVPLIDFDAGQQPYAKSTVLITSDASDESYIAAAEHVLYVVPKKVKQIFRDGHQPLFDDLSLLDTEKLGELLSIEYDFLGGDIPFQFAQSKKYVDHTDVSVASGLPEYALWHGHLPVQASIEGQVVHGFKRGSKELGVPTANIEMTEQNVHIAKNLVPGVYYAVCQFSESASHDTDKVYACALSIGWNPQYENAMKTVEVFIIEHFAEDFYGEKLKIELKAFLRGEALFGNFDSLILAIQCDIQASNQLFKAQHTS